jgi:hypothetical protein
MFAVWEIKSFPALRMGGAYGVRPSAADSSMRWTGGRPPPSLTGLRATST